ncbi:MAG TPA: recombinase [Candidatus Scalindua sp.]|nr:recombinase [Candidatus Scalindua sp.]
MAKLKLSSCDEWWSLYIRARDCDESGMGRCCSCSKGVFWKDADAGHFISRRHRATRYNEKNVHLQCRACNRFDDGNPAGYALFLMRVYGNDDYYDERVIIDLRVLSRGSTRWTQFEINSMRDDFKIKAKQLAKEKGLIL